MTLAVRLAEACGCCGTGGGPTFTCGCFCRNEHGTLFALVEAADDLCPCVDAGVDGRTLSGPKQGQFTPTSCSWRSTVAGGPWTTPSADCATFEANARIYASDKYVVQIIGSQHCDIGSPDTFAPGILEVSYFTSELIGDPVLGAFLGRVRYAPAVLLSAQCDPPIVVWRYDFLDQFGTACTGGSFIVTFTD